MIWFLGVLALIALLLLFLDKIGYFSHRQKMKEREQDWEIRKDSLNDAFYYEELRSIRKREDDAINRARQNGRVINK